MEFQNEYLSCQVSIIDNNTKIRIIGNVYNRSIYKNILLIAPNPIDKTASYHGTGLPFPSADIAFEGTVNKYNIDVSGLFNIVFAYPNSYYIVSLAQKVISSIFFVLEDANGNKKFVRFELKDMYPLRSLVDRENRNGPEFYSAKYDILHIDTAEVIMKEYSKLKAEKGLA